MVAEPATGSWQLPWLVGNPVIAVRPDPAPPPHSYAERVIGPAHAAHAASSTWRGTSTRPARAGHSGCARKTSAVNASAGKNDSIIISCSVTSCAVPKMVTVLMKPSTPAGVRMRNGITTPRCSP